MRILGNNPLASFIKRLIDLVYYLAILGAGAFTLVTMWILFFDVERVSVQVPIQFEIDPKLYTVSSEQFNIQRADLKEARGNLQIEGLQKTHLLFQAGIGLLSLFTSLVVLNRLRAIFGSLKDQNPFISANASRIRFIAIVVVLGEILSKSLLAWSSATVANEVSLSGLKLRSDLDLDLTVLFLGLVLMIISEVIRIGSRMKADLETARDIQTDLVPAEEFEQAQFQIHSLMRPANTVGGDYYDLIRLGESKLGVVLGDVSGKGMPAAMLMASLQGSLRTLISAGFRGRELIFKLNNYLCENTPENRLVTLFFGELDLLTGVFQYVNAGHNPPIWLQKSGAIHPLKSTCMALGIAEGLKVLEETVQIEPEEQLLLFTDGISEAFNKDFEAFGEDRLTQGLLRHRRLPPRQLIREILRDVQAFTGSARQSDDMTLMLIRHQNGPSDSVSTATVPHLNSERQ